MSTTHSRHFTNDAPSLRRVNAEEELHASLTRIINHCHPDNPPPREGWTFSGLYAGPTSTAFLFHKLSQSHPHLQLAQRSMHDWCLAYLELGKHRHESETGRPDPSHCGIGQEKLVHLALTAAVKADSAAATELCGYVDLITSVHREGSDEWLYGRAGFLYLLRLAASAFPDDAEGTKPLLMTTQQKVVERILKSRIPWEWHQKAYLGAVHGAIGIITQIVLSSPAHAAEKLLQGTLEWVLDLQFPSGNFPSSYPVGSDRLVQVCHGAPGFVIALESLRPHVPTTTLNDRIDDALQRAREDIWERGLLTKEPGLCHGISGNALAFDDDARFEHFLSFTTTEQLERRWELGTGEGWDAFYGLYTGEAGRAWAWAVMDKGLERRLIGFNDL
jgi:hypothetical protein